MNYALIMAGGIGTRLWPLSRRNRPKQTLQLAGEHTMFQHAVDRIAPNFEPAQICVVTREAHVASLSEQVPELPLENFIVEPEGRGTAPAIGLGAIHLRRRDPGATMAVLTADHHIANTERFFEALAAGLRAARQGHLVTLGVQPSFPATGYGYIEQGESLGAIGNIPLFRVDRFTEKPDRDTATEMVRSGGYSWNSGMFLWRVERILKEFEQHMPQLHAQLVEIESVLGTPDYHTTLARLWPQVAKQTIDYGVMERAEDIVVIPVDIGWSDVGSWTSVFELLAHDGQGNASVGPHLSLDTRDTLVFGGERLIATLGVEGLVIVDAGDALLICPHERAQDVRRVVERLEQDGHEDLL